MAAVLQVLPGGLAENGPAHDVICAVCDVPGAPTTVEMRGADVEVRCSCGALLFAVRAGEADLDEVRAHALEVFLPDAVDWWIDWPNPLLDGETPRALVERGDVARVHGLLEAIADGVLL